MNELKNKISLLLGSIRFWQVTIAAASQIIAVYVPSLQGLWDIISLWMLTVLGLGTLDKVAGTLAARKPTEPHV